MDDDDNLIVSRHRVKMSELHCKSGLLS